MRDFRITHPALHLCFRIVIAEIDEPAMPPAWLPSVGHWALINGAHFSARCSSDRGDPREPARAAPVEISPVDLPFEQARGEKMPIGKKLAGALLAALLISGAAVA